MSTIKMLLTPGKLWIVATPLGNLADLSPRACEVLQKADLVLAEDTRRARGLFGKCGIQVKNLESFFEHNEAEKQEEIIERLQNGEDIALITDAGTPLMADPGFRLVQACRQQKIPVTTAPGPSAPVTALSIAGIAPIPFTFLGFLPRTDSDIKILFEKFASIPGSLVFFERKNRLEKSLQIACQVLGERPLAVCRELTKLHEEVIFTSLHEFAAVAHSFQGELTIVIGPPAKSGKTSEEDVRKLLEGHDAAMKPRQVARMVASRVDGWSSSEIYNLIHKN